MKKNCLVHRLVAETFIENPHRYSDINHKDEDKSNNSVENLEWCSHVYNMNYGSVKKKISMAAQGRITSEETKQKLSIDTSRRRWINDGTAERYVYIDELFLFLSKGWMRGRLKKGRKRA